MAGLVMKVVIYGYAQATDDEPEVTVTVKGDRAKVFATMQDMTTRHKAISHEVMEG